MAKKNEHCCTYCGTQFSSRNRLFAHFREGGRCTELSIAAGMPVPDARAAVTTPLTSTDQTGGFENDIAFGDDEDLLVHSIAAERQYLVLGECDFSFSAALAKRLTADAAADTTRLSQKPEKELSLLHQHKTCLRATSYLSETLKKNLHERHTKWLRERGAQVGFEVDARTCWTPTDASDNMNRSYDRIIFCFPRVSARVGKTAGPRTKSQENEDGADLNARFFRAFFAGARNALRESSGRLALLLNVCSDASGVVVDQWEEWGLNAIAAASGLRRTRVRSFRRDEFPGYQPRTEAGEVFAPGERRGCGSETNESLRRSPGAVTALWHFLRAADAPGGADLDVAAPNKKQIHSGRSASPPGAVSGLGTNASSCESGAASPAGVPSTSSTRSCSPSPTVDGGGGPDAQTDAFQRQVRRRLQRHAVARRMSAEEYPVPAAVRVGLAQYRPKCVHSGEMLAQSDCVFYVERFAEEVLIAPTTFTGAPPPEAEDTFSELRRTLDWKEKRERNNRITAYHRLTAKHESVRAGEDACFQLSPATPLLATLKRRVEDFYREKSGVSLDFNVCVANLYRDGADHLAWHADFEEYGRQTPIASLSFGATREFLLRSVSAREDRMTLRLKDGSLLLMENLCQHRYVHCVPRAPAKKEGVVQKDPGRINLTFRCVPQEYVTNRKNTYF